MLYTYALLLVVLLRKVIGLKNSRHFVIQSEEKAKTNRDLLVQVFHALRRLHFHL